MSYGGGNPQIMNVIMELSWAALDHKAFYSKSIFSFFVGFKRYILKVIWTPIKVENIKVVSEIRNHRTEKKILTIPFNCFYLTFLYYDSNSLLICLIAFKIAFKQGFWHKTAVCSSRSMTVFKIFGRRVLVRSLAATHEVEIRGNKSSQPQCLPKRLPVMSIFRRNSLLMRRPVGCLPSAIWRPGSVTEVC